ncbi:hypothetical protein PUMCH_003278 [Australozyma saopauloensis]|uniref:Octanoyltransferase n=1 Tax=Australozyma saopauloensis TaxID=291208 RepID=A0AAX4HBW7_9ASCO|nr:hypothetical protein PUMCH_003278 [[Candida] saopauloensis]
MMLSTKHLLRFKLQPLKWAKGYSSCTSFTPLNDNYKTLRHIHFEGITPFERGQTIQNSFVAANLDFKKLEAKIKKLQRELLAQNFVVAPEEQDILDKILNMRPYPTLLTFQFENVYTGGKQMKQDPDLNNKIESYAKLGCQYYQLERGGQVTWHGPGQLTAYLILDLKQFKNLTVRCYVDSVLLRSVMNVLKKQHGIDSHLNENPGVWIDSNNDKIASVGCNIQRAITSYGVGVNVHPDLSFMNTNEMCGLPDAQATSIEKLTGKKVGIEEVSDQLARELAVALNMKAVEKMSGADMP